MTLKKRFLRLTHLFFIILVAIQFLPDRCEKPSEGIYVIVVALAIEALLLLGSIFIKKPLALTLFLDIVGVIFIFLIVWTLASAKFVWVREALFPPPGRVFAQFVEDLPKILINVKSSLLIIVQGYLIAAAIAIPLGLFLGWSARIGTAATYIFKFVSAIPPIVYIPYGIALLPTFRSVSVMVIFLATFWPVLASTMSGVMNVDKKITDSAKVLNVNTFTMMFSVILPAALPQIFIGCNQGLTVSFILLTSAEMIGARDGLGYYVKNYSDFGDYTRTILGIIIIGIVVVAISFLFNKLQKYLLKWKR
ncbi:MAG: ABC transporter permease subunit [Parasporobacterium sp.]|nr:ABC transporter permease subunit [Parasporobacterium sp.]